MKKVLSIVLLIIAAFTISGCQAEQAYSVALLVPGAVNDGGWSQTGYKGLLAVEEDLGVEIRYTENVGADSAIKVMSDYANAGVNVIFGHGMQYYDAALEIMGDYPDVDFIITSTTSSESPNVNSLLINNKEMGFVAGYMAYALGKDQMIFFEGAPYTSIILSGWGVMAGFEYAHEMDAGTSRVIKNVIVEMDNTTDVQAAKSLALTMANSNDWDAEKLSFTSSANDATRGAVLAGDELSIPVIGFYTNKSQDSDMMLMDVLTNDPATFVQMVEKAMNDELTGNHYLFGVADEVVVPTEIYDTYRGDIPAGLQGVLDELIADIVAGNIDVDGLTDAWGEANW